MWLHKPMSNFIWVWWSFNFIKNNNIKINSHHSWEESKSYICKRYRSSGKNHFVQEKQQKLERRRLLIFLMTIIILHIYVTSKDSGTLDGDKFKKHNLITNCKKIFTNLFFFYIIMNETLSWFDFLSETWSKFWFIKFLICKKNLEHYSALHYLVQLLRLSAGTCTGCSKTSDTIWSLYDLDNIWLKLVSCKSNLN